MLLNTLDHPYEIFIELKGKYIANTPVKIKELVYIFYTYKLGASKTIKQI